MAIQLRLIRADKNDTHTLTRICHVIENINLGQCSICANAARGLLRRLAQVFGLDPQRNGALEVRKYRLVSLIPETRTESSVSNESKTWVFDLLFQF